MKKALIVAAILLIVLILVVVLLPFVLPVSIYKDRIIAAVEQATGRNFAIKGPISLSLLPRTEIDVSDVTLGNPPGVPGDMAQLGKLELRVNPLALFSRRLEVDSFVLVDPKITLAVDKNGRANWQFAGAKGAGSGAAAPSGAPSPAPKAGQPPSAAIAPG